MAGCCKCGNEPSGSITCGEFSNCGSVSFLGRSLLHGINKRTLHEKGFINCDVTKYYESPS